MFTKVQVATTFREGLINITESIREVVRTSGIKEGVCVLYVPHTTAAITLNSCLDPATLQDLTEELHRLVPTRVDFHHTYDTPADAAGHIKSTLVGHSLMLLITQGEIALGGSQSILFFEFDGPRQREVWVRVIRDTD
ncbi:secondary thiamine-phosphate synthase enzyme [Thermanaerothrix daxensis]|uniref:Secondary thiamine-phosphate synthase enzyme n=1 Tax=Thermanaerothrix daxensis TaxID=869279 RepID=A0A0P6Y5X1_9CHLR|nr:secondary thiamine-phosphate synthase enzyme YjbQ [Thermanaerothrix daxensis]KPL84367.1 secondary thiamine-phosphate synthase enzyme [Thermanaerothrix daxensis]